MRINQVRILSFDPGTTCLGWAVSNFDTKTTKFQVVKFGNILPSTISKKLKSDCEQYTQQLISLEVIENLTKELITTYTPTYIVTEDAFFQPKRVNAFIALKFCIHTIARVSKNFGMGIYKLAPCDIKKMMSGSGHANKITIQDAIINHPDISFKAAKQIAFDKMVEHEADAIAVGWAFTRHLLVP